MDCEINDKKCVIKKVQVCILEVTLNFWIIGFHGARAISPFQEKSRLVQGMVNNGLRSQRCSCIAMLQMPRRLVQCILISIASINLGD